MPCNLTESSSFWTDCMMCFLRFFWLVGMKASCRADYLMRFVHVCQLDGRQACCWADHLKYSCAVSFNSTGSRLVTASADGTARVYNATTGACVSILVRSSFQSPGQVSHSFGLCSCCDVDQSYGSIVTY